MNKLSATSISDFLRSPRYFYYRYVLGIVPAEFSEQRFDHDKVFGSVWASFVDAFYKGMSQNECVDTFIPMWRDNTQWMQNTKERNRLDDALSVLMSIYFNKFRPDDGARAKEQSELWVESDLFYGRLDGLSPDRIVHECKATKHAQTLKAQLARFQHSIQVKLYAVLTEATGIRVELAFKDEPYDVFRASILHITGEQRQEWSSELVALAAAIDTMRFPSYYGGRAAVNWFPCHREGCTIVSKRFTGECPYQPLCDGEISLDSEEFNKLYRRKNEHSTRSDSSTETAE